MKKIKITGINKIGNVYGGLLIKKENRKYYWIIEDHDTNLNDLSQWVEISKTLYDELLKYNLNNPEND